MKIKKILIALAAVTMLTMMIANVYAVAHTMPTPLFCEPYCSCGFTPGFWKHNINVYLGNTNGKYSAFSWTGTMYPAGTKLNADIMDDLLDAINLKYDPDVTFEELLEALEGPGWSADRTNAANLLNEAAGYGPF